MTSHACFKDFSVEECLFPKRCYSSEDIWTCYPARTNFTKKEALEAVPKSRKKLTIIDPVTGKNVLEGVTDPESCADYLETGSFEPENFHSNSTENRYEDYYCSDDMEQDLQAASEVCEEAIACSTSEDTYWDKMKDISSEADFENEKASKDNLNPPVSLNITMTSETIDKNLSHSKDGVETCINTSSDKANTTPKVLENSDPQKLFSEQLPKGLKPQESSHQSEGFTTSQSHLKTDYCSHGCKESTPKSSECIKEGFKHLKEKVYSLRQEQQKMAILQSFLRYKKFQLEESAKSLDEKRIEIANWECNLYNKAKRLHEKEQWLQNKSEILYEKAVKLAHRERIVNSQEDLNSSSGSKNSSLKRFMNDDRDISWESPSSKYRSSRSKETGDELSYSEHSNKAVHSSPALSVSKCKSVMSSLEQLEKNIVMIEKIHASKEIGDNSDMKSESAPSHSTPNKNENASLDPIGQSKGRHYLPEHIKYWLNKRDKSTL